MSFSVGGSQAAKVAFVRDAIRRYGLDLDRHFAAFFGDVVRYGRSFDDCIVGEDGLRMLTAGRRESTHHELPDDYDAAMSAVAGFFRVS